MRAFFSSILLATIFIGCVLPTQSKPLVSRFSISPRLFNPLTQRAVVISYTLAHPALVSIGVYSEDGTLIKVLASNRQAIAGDNTEIWIGDSSTAGFADAGVYVIRLSVEGGETYEGSIVVVYF